MAKSISLSLSFSILFFAIAAKSEDWPQWRGPNRDGHSTETGLLKEWPKDGPPVVWTVENVGVGYSSPTVANGRIFTLGDLEGVEHVICLNAKDGSLVWAVQPDPVAKQLEDRVAQDFERADKDGDGELSELEVINNIGRGAGSAESVSDGDKASIAKTRSAKLMQQLDKNDDGLLTYSEVPRSAVNDFFQRVDWSDPNADEKKVASLRVAEALKRDSDGDGKVSEQEARDSVLQIFFHQIDQKLEGERRGDKQLTKEELEKYFSTRDKGRDGAISTDELARYYEQSSPGRDGVMTKSDMRRHLGGYRNGQGDGPRGTPTVEGNRVYTEGGNGDVTCLDATTGKTIWHLNLVRDFSGGRPGWGYSESPLIVNDMLIVTPGGNLGTVVALDKHSGETVWRTSEVQEGAHYSSPVVAKIAGHEQIVQFARNSVFGVTLDKGNFLWKYSGANNGTANVCTPIVSADHVLTSSSYGTGGGLVKVSKENSQQTAKEVYFEKDMAVHHGGIVKVGDHVYGFGNGGLICMEFLTGEIAWRDRSVGKGSLIFADGDLYLFSERGDLALAEANPEEYIEKGRVKLPATDRPSWAHPAIADGRLYIRDQKFLTCYDISLK